MVCVFVIQLSPDIPGFPPIYLYIDILLKLQYIGNFSIYTFVNRAYEKECYLTIRKMFVMIYDCRKYQSLRILLKNKGLLAKFDPIR